MKFIRAALAAAAVAASGAAVATALPVAAQQAESGDPAADETWATVEPGPDGLAVVVGDADSNPTVVANLAVAGMETRMWTGYGCLTGSGRYVAATFAPVEFIDTPALRDGGAFLAIIDLENPGDIQVLEEQVALKYHTPGCGPDDEIAAVRHNINEETGDYSTDVLAIDGASGSVTWQDDHTGKLAWPAPAGGDVLLAAGPEIMTADGQGLETITTLEGEVVDLHAAPDGADFSVLGQDDSLDVYSLTSGTTTRVATGKIGEARWATGADGNNLLQATDEIDVFHADHVVPVEDIADAVSLNGETVASAESVGTPGGVPDGTDSDPAASAQSIEIDQLGVESSEADATVSVQLAESIPDTSQLLRFESQVDGVCAVPRNDPSIQVIQPSPEQVEWAAHRAVRGELTMTRPANWNNNGLPAYQPQSEFPLRALDGGGRIPAQVLLGVLAQESNLWQAARGALPGMAANPLIGNYYGVIYHTSGPDQGKIQDFDLADADCGYGIGQITDGMTKADTGSAGRSAAEQKMIATDYLANIAEAQRILADKWNQLYGTIIPAGTDPTLIENWYLPLWAYNCCYYGPPNSVTGMGWTNNPANSDYEFDRLYFLRAGLDDARTPGNWTYPERVMGFIEHGLFLYGERAFTPISGTLDGLPVEGIGPVPYNQPVDRFAFCDSTNGCSPTHFDPGNVTGGSQPVQGDQSFCTRSDRRCWWNQPMPFTPSPVVENAAPYVDGQASEPGVASPYPAACGPNNAAMPEHGVITSIPASAVIVDNVPAGTPNVAGCGTVRTAGSFDFTLGDDVAEIDLHQIGSGYGGHFWYGHSVRATRPDHEVTGTWTPPTSTVGWQRILVHIPAVGAVTYQADYQIYDGTEGPGEAATYHRVVNQRWRENRWVDLGVFPLSSGARVELSNVTYSDHGDPIPATGAVDESYAGSGAISMAWDAVAFVPSSKPTVAMVTFGDSYTSGEGFITGDYFANSDVYKNSSNTTNGCHRSPEAYGPRSFAELTNQTPGDSTYAFVACSGATLVDHVSGPFTRWGESPQQSSGWVDQNTTHVTVGIGGNDVRFSDILKHCLGAFTRQCNEDLVEFNGTEMTIDERLQLEISALIPRYREFVQRLRADGPDARITLVGYPYVVGSGDAFGGVIPSECAGFSDLELDWLRSSTDVLNNSIRELADSIANVEFASISPVYRGKEACTGGQFINDVDIEFGCGACDDLSVASAASFHPNALGHAAATPIVVDALTRPAGSNDGTGRIEGSLKVINDDEPPYLGEQPVELYLSDENNPSGDRISTTTAADGSYAFDGLDAGCYVAVFHAPENTVFDSNRSDQMDVLACVQSGDVRVFDALLLYTPPTPIPADDDPTISVESQTVTEGNGQSITSIAFVLDQRTSTEGLSVRYRTVSVSAGSDEDFVPFDGRVTFAENQLSRTRGITIIGDGIPEGTEEFQVVLYDPVGLNLGSVGIVTIEDDD